MVGTSILGSWNGHGYKWIYSILCINDIADLPAKIGDYPQIWLKGPKLAGHQKWLKGSADFQCIGSTLWKPEMKPMLEIGPRSHRDLLGLPVWMENGLYPQSVGEKNNGEPFISFSIKLARFTSRCSRWFTFFQRCRHGHGTIFPTASETSHVL